MSYYSGILPTGHLLDRGYARCHVLPRGSDEPLFPLLPKATSELSVKGRGAGFRLVAPGLRVFLWLLLLLLLSALGVY